MSESLLVKLSITTLFLRGQLLHDYFESTTLNSIESIARLLLSNSLLTASLVQLHNSYIRNQLDKSNSIKGRVDLNVKAVFLFSTHSFVKGAHSDHPNLLFSITNLKKGQENKAIFNTFIYT